MATLYGSSDSCRSRSLRILVLIAVMALANFSTSSRRGELLS